MLLLALALILAVGVALFLMHAQPRLENPRRFPVLLLGGQVALAAVTLLTINAAEDRPSANDPAETCKDLGGSGFPLAVCGIAVLGGLAWGLAGARKDKDDLEVAVSAGMAIVLPYAVVVYVIATSFCGWN